MGFLASVEIRKWQGEWDFWQAGIYASGRVNEIFCKRENTQLAGLCVFLQAGKYASGRVNGTFLQVRKYATGRANGIFCKRGNTQVAGQIGFFASEENVQLAGQRAFCFSRGVHLFQCEFVLDFFILRAERSLTREYLP